MQQPYPYPGALQNNYLPIISRIMSLTIRESRTLVSPVTRCLARSGVRLTDPSLVALDAPLTSERLGFSRVLGQGILHFSVELKTSPDRLIGPASHATGAGSSQEGACPAHGPGPPGLRKELTKFAEWRCPVAPSQSMKFHMHVPFSSFNAAVSFCVCPT